VASEGNKNQAHAPVAGPACWHDSVAARRQRAYLPGALRLYENMTGRQIVQFLGRLRGRAPDGRADALARRFEEAVSLFLAEQAAAGPSDALCSALAAAYRDEGPRRPGPEWLQTLFCRWAGREVHERRFARCAGARAANRRQHPRVRTELGNSC